MKDADKLDVPKLLPVSVAILDRSGTIVGVNDAWKDFGRRSNLRIPNFGVGANYLLYCQSERSDSVQLINDLRDLLAGKLDLLTRIYPCHSPTERRWFFMFGLPLSSEGRSGVAILHVDLTPRLPLPMIAGGSPNVTRMIDSDLIAGSVESSSLEALSSQLTTMLMESQSTRLPEVGEPIVHPPLSKRQLEVLGLLAEGKTNIEIARALSRSPHTIKLHVSAILRQLNVKSSHTSSPPCVHDSEERTRQETQGSAVEGEQRLMWPISIRVYKPENDDVRSAHPVFRVSLLIARAAVLSLTH